MGNIIRGFTKTGEYSEQSHDIFDEPPGEPLVSVGPEQEVVLVAGGTGAVGRGVVKALLERGHIPVVTSKFPERLQELQHEIEEYADKEGKQMPTCYLIEEDVADEEGAKHVRDLILARYGRIDRVVASLTCRWPSGPLSELGSDEFRKALDCIVASHFVVARTFLPVLFKNKHGSYTFITGRIGEFCAKPELGVSTIAASALFGLVLAFKAEAKKSKGVIVNEARVGMRVVPERQVAEEQDLFGEHQTTDPLEMGRAIAAIALSDKTRNDYPPFFLYSPEEIRDVRRDFESGLKKQESAQQSAAAPGQPVGKNKRRKKRGRTPEQAQTIASNKPQPQTPRAAEGAGKKEGPQKGDTAAKESPPPPTRERQLSPRSTHHAKPSALA